jgi:hypothetical protein
MWLVRLIEMFKKAMNKLVIHLLELDLINLTPGNKHV